MIYCCLENLEKIPRNNPEEDIEFTNTAYFSRQEFLSRLRVKSTTKSRKQGTDENVAS